MFILLRIRFDIFRIKFLRFVQFECGKTKATHWPGNLPTLQPNLELINAKRMVFF